jgi:hypothetical protein
VLYNRLHSYITPCYIAYVCYITGCYILCYIMVLHNRLHNMLHINIVIHNAPFIHLSSSVIIFIDIGKCSGLQDGQASGWAGMQGVSKHRCETWQSCCCSSSPLELSINVRRHGYISHITWYITCYIACYIHTWYITWYITWYMMCYIACYIRL